MTCSGRRAAGLPRLALFVLCFLLAAGRPPAYADDLDFGDLFETAEDVDTEREDVGDPDDDADVEETPDLLRQFEQDDAITVRGSVVATGGFVYGWTDWPDTDDLSANQKSSPEFSSKFRLSFDARPHSALRLYGEVSTKIDPEERQYEFTDIEIEELFLDYNLNDTVFVRAGQHKMKWGQGRIFTPGNLMDESEEGTAIRVNVPTVLDGVSMVVLAQEQFFPEDETQSWLHLAYAGQASVVAGPVLLTGGGRWQEQEGLRTLASVKTVVGRTDLFADVVTRYRDEEWALQTVTGFYHDWNDLHLYGEYQYDGTTDLDNDHSLGLALAKRRIFGSKFHLGAVWEHTFADDSGQVVPGISWTPWRFITARVGFPVVYGEDDSRYVLDNEDPYNRRVSAIFQLQLSASF